MKRSSIENCKTKVLNSFRGSVVCSIASLMGVLLISLVLSAGCGRSGGSEGNLFQIPWPGDDGSYHLKNVSITTYDHPDTLQGKFVKIFVDPFVSEGQLSGSTPIGRFVHNKEGVGIPMDYATLQATAIHAHFERFNQMDEAVGAQQNRPARIGIQANVVDKDGAVHDNAIYDGQLDALLVVPYSQDFLPISINGGILAHEHFHMIFQELVLKRIGASGKTDGKLAVISRRSEWSDMMGKKNPGDGGQSNDKLGDKESDKEQPTKPDPALIYNLFFLRALNEGLADFWAWVYTGDPKFIGHSLPAQTEFRRMDLKIDQLSSQDEILSRITNDVGQFLNDDAMVNRAYMIGTSYSRAFRELTSEISVSGDKPTFEERMAVARSLVQALPSFAESVVAAQTKKTLVSPNAILQAVFAKLDPQSPQKTSPADSKVSPYAKGCAVIARIAAPEANSFAKDLSCGSVNAPEVSAVPDAHTEPAPLTPSATPTMNPSPTPLATPATGGTP